VRPSYENIDYNPRQDVKSRTKKKEKFKKNRPFTEIFRAIFNQTFPVILNMTISVPKMAESGLKFSFFPATIFPSHPLKMVIPFSFFTFYLASIVFYLASRAFSSFL